MFFCVGEECSRKLKLWRLLTLFLLQRMRRVWYTGRRTEMWTFARPADAGSPWRGDDITADCAEASSATDVHNSCLSPMQVRVAVFWRVFSHTKTFSFCHRITSTWQNLISKLSRWFVNGRIRFTFISRLLIWRGATVFSYHPLINWIQISQGEVITSLPFAHAECAAVKKNGRQNFANSNFKSISSLK